MCYLVAKKADGIGSIALQTSHGQHLVDFKKKIINNVWNTFFILYGIYFQAVNLMISCLF